MLRIRTFGGCHVERGGARLEELSGRRRALALLAVLASAGAQGATRDSLLALLWPDSDEGQARTSLKQLVHTVRRQLGEPGLFLPTGNFRLDPDRVASDVGDFRDALRRRDEEAACRSYTGAFLDGFSLQRAHGFERWAADERVSLARECARALHAVAERADRDRDVSSAAAHWRRLAALEPLSSRAAVGLMRALNAAGDRAAALQHARDFQRHVQEELGGEPDGAVAQLADRFLRPEPAVTVSTPAASAPSVPSAPSLAVLPFANTSGDSADEHFSDGLTDELIGTIGRIGGLTVTGRTSSFAFKGKQLDVRTIARSLHVAAVLEGSVRRLGDQLKIGAQLVRADDGAVVWSEIYDREAKDIFAVQVEIAQAIAGALRVKLARAGAGRARVATSDMAAHDLYLKGRYFQNRVSEEDLRKAAGYFEQAIARDPSYAQAHAGLADACLLRAILGFAPQEVEVARVRTAVARALALDSTLADAHTSLASVLFVFDWDWPSAGREFERAIALDPAYGLAHQRYGLYLMYQGQFGEALPVLERSRALDPLAPSTSMNLGRLHLNAGRPREAVPLLQAAVELNPHLALAYEQLGNAHLKLGQPDEALAAFRRAARGGAMSEAWLSYALAVTGHREEAQEIVHRLCEPLQGEPAWVGLAIASAGLGDAEEAFRWLTKAYAGRDAFLHSIRTIPAFDGLRSDPRWGKLLRRMGLSP
jgi:TolB-like protein/DNA-binding SARP family transcriptional activator/Flp pilus assembly protein TadD